MRFSRRAPREVYRVYGEQEFLTASELGGAVQLREPGRGAHWPARAVGVTALLAATSAVGGLIALAGPWSAGARRREAGDRRAAVGRLGSGSRARTQVWQGRELASGTREPLEHKQPRLRERRVRRGLSAPRAVDVAFAGREAVAASAVPVPPAEVLARASALPRRSVHAEFGFER
jgi:hypothetical protein